MKGIARFAARRLMSAAVTLWLVSILIFTAIHGLPGGYADVFLGAQSTPQTKAQIEQKFGLDRPIPIQYWKWISAAAYGDFGVSLSTQQPVGGEFVARLPVTAQLAVMATAMALVVGLPLGLIGGLVDRPRALRGCLRLFGSLAMSVPDFVIGSLLLYLLARHSLGLRVGAWIAFSSDPASNLRTAIAPACALAALGVGFISTAARHATISIREAPWVLAAIARGESRPDIIRRHIVKNAAIPVVTVVAIYLGYMLGGTAIIESLFTVPGVGRFVLQAVSIRDYPVVQAGVLIAATVFIVLNLGADLLYAALDPRIRQRPNQ
jgi:peptide/nickel transport system permease protein